MSNVIIPSGGHLGPVSDHTKTSGKLVTALYKAVTYKHLYGTASIPDLLKQVMAEEATRMLRGWSRFDPLYQQNVRLFVDEGVSFAFFEDDFG